MPQRYALWLLPANTTAAGLAAIMHRLQQRWHTPSFPPHITLLSGTTTDVDALPARLSGFAESIAPLSLQVETMAMEAYYFRAFYLKLAATEQVLAAHTSAAAAFDCPARADYAPHLSLLYGTIARAEKLALGEEIHGDLPSQFLADRLQLVKLAVAVNDWELLDAVDLAGG
jgi:2'-5' RNA ligase